MENSSPETSAADEEVAAWCPSFLELCWAGGTAWALIALSRSSISPPTPDYRVVSNQESTHEWLELNASSATGRNKQQGEAAWPWQEQVLAGFLLPCLSVARAPAVPCLSPACPRHQQGLGGVTGMGEQQW